MKERRTVEQYDTNAKYYYAEYNVNFFGLRAFKDEWED